MAASGALRAGDGAGRRAGVLATRTYNNLGQAAGVARAGGAGAASSYGYDAFGRLETMTQNPSGTTHDLTLEFAYNPAGQIVRLRRRRADDAPYAKRPPRALRRRGGLECRPKRTGGV